MKFHLFLVLVMVLQTTSCSFVLDVGVEPLSAPETIPPTATVIATATELPTTTPTMPPTPIPTHTPSPTPLPGSVVVPVTSLGTDIPWLPLDKTKWPTTVVVTFNTQIPPFNNPLVRKAFAASVDRDAIVAMAKKWYAVDPSPATTFLHPMTLGRDLYGEVGINYDPVLAKDLLAQAGYTDTSSFPRVTFIANSYGDTAPGAKFNMASAMAAAWHSTLGVTVDVLALERLSFRDRIQSNPPELIWIGWLPDPGNDPNFIRDNYRTDGLYNYGHFSNPDFDALVDRASTLHDPAERQELYIQAERILCETEVGIIPLYFTFSNLP